MIELIWFLFITYWLTTYCRVGQSLSIAIARSQWGCINLFMVSLIWERRAIPLYWSLLQKLGSSNFEEQTTNLQPVLPLFSEYKVIVLGDREFCSIEARILAEGKGCVFLLKTEEESLYRNRTFSWITVKSIRNSITNLLIF